MGIMTMLNSVFTSLASIVQKFLAFFLVFTTVAAPSTATPITAIDENSVQLTFTALGDTQVNALTNNGDYFEAILKDVDAAETTQDAFLVAGDITENSLVAEWDFVADTLKEYNFGENLILATGNHDIRLRDYEETRDLLTGCIMSVTGEKPDDTHYLKEINGYTFIILSSDIPKMEDEFISVKQLKWADKALKKATKSGKPVFVVMHQPLKDTHGLPLTWGDGSNSHAGHIGNQSDAIYTMLNKYKNVILITGHLHTGFGEYLYEKVGNVHCVNLPGAGKKNDNGDYCNYSTGFSVEVYEGEVIFRARDFGKGIYLPEYDIEIPVSPVE